MHKYIDDDRDFILPTPTNTFMGYKCPYDQCVVITPNHDYCLSVKQRLDGIAGNKREINDWFERFQFNWEAWKLRTNFDSATYQH